MQPIIKAWIALLLMCASTAYSQNWKPERNVELVIPTSPGGSNDIAGRTLHMLLNDLKLLPVSSSVAAAVVNTTSRTPTCRSVTPMRTLSASCPRRCW